MAAGMMTLGKYCDFSKSGRAVVHHPVTKPSSFEKRISRAAGTTNRTSFRRLIAI
jgi:hypothetical protein